MDIFKSRHYMFICLFTLLFASKSYANCYWPNGTDRNALLLQGDVYQPCNGGDKFSMCCATNRTPADRCRSDGLCQSTYDNNVWRDSCTDPYWKSPKCIKLCDRGIGHYRTQDVINMSDADVTVTPCDDGSYCCGNGTLAENCCNDKKGVFVIDGVTTDVNPSSTSKSASSTSSASTSSTSSASTSSSASPSTSASPTLPSNFSPALASSPTNTISTSSSTKSSSSNHTGAIVGGVIGGIAVVGLLILAALFLQRRRMQRTPLGLSWRGENPQIFYEAPPNVTRTELDARQMTELDGGRVHHEMQ